jgi:8-oxo-dGTP diphosphatase
MQAGSEAMASRRSRKPIFEVISVYTKKIGIFMQCSQLAKIGCGVLIKKQNQILLGKRKNCYGAGTWAMPGGHLNHLEKLMDAAKRELREELAIEEVELKFLALTDDIEDKRHYIHVTFLLDNFEGEFKLLEPERCEEWKFFPLDSLPNPLFPPHIRILDTVFKNLHYQYE